MASFQKPVNSRHLLNIIGNKGLRRFLEIIVLNF